MLTLKPNELRPASKNQVNFDHLHKTKSIDHHTKTSQFRPAQSQLDPPHQNKSISIPALNPSQVRSLTQKSSKVRPHHCNQVNFDPHCKFKLISMPRHKNQVGFNTDTKTKSFSTPTKKKVNLIQTLKRRVFRPSHKIQANSDPETQIKSWSIAHTEMKSTSTTHTKT